MVPEKTSVGTSAAKLFQRPKIQRAEKYTATLPN